MLTRWMSGWTQSFPADVGDAPDAPAPYTASVPESLRKRRSQAERTIRNPGGAVTTNTFGWNEGGCFRALRNLDQRFFCTTHVVMQRCC